MAVTYEAIATQTASGSAGSITFSSIPSTYTDLVMVINASNASGEDASYVQVGNGSIDTGSNYSTTALYGNGSSAASYRESNSSSGMNIARIGQNFSAITLIHFMNYSNTTTYKTAIARANTSVLTMANVGLWRSTSAINTIKVYIGNGWNYSSGSTFTLYGIKAA